MAHDINVLLRQLEEKGTGRQWHVRKKAAAVIRDLQARIAVLEEELSELGLDHCGGGAPRHWAVDEDGEDEMR